MVNRKFDIFIKSPKVVREELTPFPVVKESVSDDFPIRFVSREEDVTFPTVDNWNNLVAEFFPDDPPIEHWQYVDHRQMDRGRQIAQDVHRRRVFIQRVGDVWEFRELRNVRVDNPKYDPDFFTRPKPRDYETLYKKVTTFQTFDYFVTWDGILPLPDSTASTSSFTGRDPYIWAVYFLVNGFPPDNLWFPIPSRYPEWNSFNIGEPVPEYT